MGLIIDDFSKKVYVEIRRESITIGDLDDRVNMFPYEPSSVEITKEVLKELIKFFNENPKYLNID